MGRFRTEVNTAMGWLVHKRPAAAAGHKIREDESDTDADRADPLTTEGEWACGEVSPHPVQVLKVDNVALEGK